MVAWLGAGTAQAAAGAVRAGPVVTRPNSIAFRDLAPKLTELLKHFGPTRQSYHPEYPFWRLQNDGLWIVDDADRLERRTGQTDIPKRELLDKDVRAHFKDEIAQALRAKETP